MKNIHLAVVAGCFCAAMLLNGCCTTGKCNAAKVERYGMVIGLKAEKLDEYKKLHAAVWPDVLKMIADCHIRNYSIYLFHARENRYFLFSYFEYTGDNFKADMDKMAADPTTQRWWALCKPCQEPVRLRQADEWWANMEEVFHCE